MHDAEIRSFHLDSYRDAIQRVSRPCLNGQISKARTECYFGGLPMVPSDFVWPMKDGYPLEFIGQIRCSEIDLIPTNDGNLLFFYDSRHWGNRPSDRGHALVFHVPSNVPRVQAELPQVKVPTWWGLFQKNVRPHVYQRTDASFTASRSYPSFERKLIEFDNEDAEDAYTEFCSAIQPAIQMGGFPSPIQSDEMEQECVNALGIGPRDAWVLLLQLIELGDMVWGDAGVLYWYIHQDDLAQLRFDRVWMITQCY